MRGVVPSLRRNEVACLWQLLHVVRYGILPGDDMIFPVWEKEKGVVGRISSRVRQKLPPLHFLDFDFRESAVKISQIFVVCEGQKTKLGHVHFLPF